MKLSLRIASFLLFLLSVGIGFSAPLSGIYTIGGSSPSYATFNAAVTDITANGVNGAVIFKVRSGTYNEQINLGTIAGTSGSNTVTFQSQTGNNGDVTITYATGSSSNWVINLNGASYVTFSNMTIQPTGTTYSTAVMMSNSASYNKLVGLVINGAVASSAIASQVLVNLTQDGSCCNYNGVYSSTLNNGSYGLYNIFGYSCGSSYNYGIQSENNTFINQYAGAIYYVRALTGSSIQFNTITTNSTDTAYIGIQTYICEDTICNNTITNCPGTGIYFENCSPFIFNNFVEITGQTVNYGILFKWDNYCANLIFITENTVLVLNTNNQSSAFYMPFPGYTWNFPVNYIQDNIFVNRGGGYAINITNNGSVTYPNPYSQSVTLDYNDYYTTGTNIGVWGSTICTTFANWQSTISGCGCSGPSHTAGDTHSKNINPAFVSNTDLHLTTDDLRYGTPATYGPWPIDIDGQTRNGVTPDMGADEFTAPSASAQFTGNNTTVCVGSQVTFTDQSTGSPLTWKWTFKGGKPGSSNSPNPIVSYDTTGTFDVKLVITTSTGTDSLTKQSYITVNALPTIGSITSNADSVCSGGSTLLTLKGNTGTIQWQSSSVPGPYADINGANSNTYTASSLSQNTNYRVVLNNGTCTDTSAAFTIVVNPLPNSPTLSASDSSICPNDSTIITASGIYASYLWNNNDTGSSIRVNTEGPYSVTVTDANGCTASSGQLGIVVFPAPSPPTLSALDTMICSYDSTQIIALGNYISYQWNNGDTTNHTYALAAGNYRVTVSDANGCVTVSDNQNIGIFSVPSVSIDVKGDTLFSFNSSTYQWYFNDSVIPGANSPVYIAAQSGNYAVQITDSNGCKALSNFTSVTINGISNITSKIQWVAYPNPFSNSLFIRWNNLFNEIKGIEIYDLLGRMIYLEEALNKSNSELEINAAKIPSGIYYLKMNIDGQHYCQKITKQ